MLVTLDHTATGVALILVDGKAENMISVAPGANAGLTAEHVRTALGRLAPHQGDVVLVTHEISTEAAREALRIGRQGGAWTVFNPAPAGGLDRAVLALADVLTPNRGELARLVGDDAKRSGRAAAVPEDPVRAAKLLLEATRDGADATRALLVTLGSTGAVLVRRDAPQLEIRSPKVKAVDATGAGDSLNGALAAALAVGLDLETACRRAVVAASLSVTRAGAREGMPALADLNDKLIELGIMVPPPPPVNPDEAGVVGTAETDAGPA